jgi:hypothetical protein
MKSTKARKGLEDKKRWLEEQLANSKKQTEEMWSKLEKAPRETIELPTLEIINGEPVEGKQKVVVVHTDQRLEREHEDAMRAQYRLQYELGEIEFLLSPGKGRPKGRRNEKSKPIDPTFVKAREYRKTPEGRKLTLDKIAQMFSGCKNRVEWSKWKYRFQKSLRSRS